MKALVNTPKGPAPVELREVAEPNPAPHEALIAVHAFSLNRGELTLMRIRPEGWQPGQDVSGVILKAAADGSGPKEGTRVVGIMDWQGWAERAAISTHRLAALPDKVSFGAAAALPVAGLTALRSLHHGAPLLGRRVLITGAAGGVGNLAVQLAAHSGAEVTAIARGARGQPLAKLGAQHVVDEIGQAQGKFWLILESAGGASLKAALGLLEPKGTVVLFGNSSGEETSLSFRDFGAANNARIRASIPSPRGRRKLSVPISHCSRASSPRTRSSRRSRSIAGGISRASRRRLGSAAFKVKQSSASIERAIDFGAATLPRQSKIVSISPH